MVSATVVFPRPTHLPDFRAFHKRPGLYFYSSMSSAQHPHASVNNLQTGARVALFGMLVNLIFATAKILGGLFGHAYVLIADGIESALDVGGSFVIWGGLKFAARPPDETHPYGHGKAEPIAAAVVAMGVLLASIGLAIQSVREIFVPHHGPAVHARRVDRGRGREGNSLSRRDSPRQKRGEHRDPNRRLASSRRRVDVDRSVHRHFGRPHRRR